MEKGFAFGLSAITVLSGALVAVACSDSEQSTFPGEGVDASTDSPGSFVIDSGGSSSGSSGEGGAAKCEPVIADDYTAQFTAPTAPIAAPGQCSDTVIGTYFDECLGSLSDADHKTRCDAWKAANTACGDCIEPANNSGAIQWHQQRFYYTLNVAGCIAIKQDKYTNADCGFAYGAAVNCERDACGGCFKTGTSTFDEFRQCQQKAASVGLCKTLETQQASLCTGVVTTDPTKTCFNANNSEQPKVHFSRVMKVFCGGV